MKLSIITATYNSGKTLKRCLESVAQQTALTNIEHIIVDGRSSDATIKIAADFPYINKVISEQDRGIYHAFNKGIDAASGDLIYFLGSDDFLYDKYVVQDVISQFEKNDVEYLLARVKCFSENSSEVWFTNHQLDKEYSSLFHQAFFCKKHIFNRVGYFSECFKIAADNYFMQSVVKKFSGFHYDRVISCFAQTGISSTLENRLCVKKELQAIRLLHDDEKISKEQELDKNNEDLKLLIEKQLTQKSFLSTYQGKSVLIFGTRKLSVLIQKMMTGYDVLVVGFLVSKKQDLSEISGIRLYSLDDPAEIRNVEVVINCIEGAHEAEVAENIQQHLPTVRVVSWRDL